MGRGRVNLNPEDYEFKHWSKQPKFYVNIFSSKFTEPRNNIYILILNFINEYTRDILYISGLSVTQGKSLTCAMYQYLRLTVLCRTHLDVNPDYKRRLIIIR